MPAPPGLPELVIFDVDGTLQDTRQWWPEVIARGVALHGRKLGRDLPVPEPEQACSVIGLRDEQVWGPFLPPDLRERWRELRETVIPLEVATLSTGRDYLFPGTRDMLVELRRAGVRLALASNCRSGYFAAVRAGQGLGPLVDAAYCLDSPGVTCKRDMVRIALAEAGTRCAVMVGDRGVDQDAAVAAGIPFVQRTGGQHDAEVQAPAARFRHSAELPGILATRRERVAQLATELRARAAGRPLRIGVTGPPCAGKTGLARELAASLPALVSVALDDFLLPPGKRPPAADPDDHLTAAFDLDAVEQRLQTSDSVLLEGLFLLHPRLRRRLDQVVFMAASDDEILRRAAGRGSDDMALLRAAWLPAHRRFHARLAPEALAEVWFANDNPLCPEWRWLRNRT